MMALKRRISLVNALVVFSIMFLLMGLTACSGATDSVANQGGSNIKNVENRQKNINKTQEVQSSDPTSSSVSRLEEQSQIVSGKCGKEAVWTYDTISKQLQITGIGVVDQIIKKSEEYVTDYGFKKRYQVKEIRIGEGITALDAGPLFLNLDKAKEIKEIKLFLPNSLEKIGADTFDPGQNGLGYIRHIYLPQRVRYIEGGAFWGLGDAEKLKKYKNKFEITVDRRNPYYVVIDDVLFTKNKKTLVYYPSEKKNKIYRIPKSVTKIEALAFARNSFLKEVVLPKDLKVIGAGAFFNDEKLTKINLEEVNKLKQICDFDGEKCKLSISCETGLPIGIHAEAVYDSDERYHDPLEYRNAFYAGKGTKVRKDYYFLGTFAGTNLKSVRFPERLKYVACNTFKNCFHLKKIIIGKSFAGEINPDQLADKKGFFLPDCPAIEIRVSEGNEHYQIRNHILYSKDGKTMYKALKSYRDSALVLDKDVRKIARKAFSGDVAKKLRKVVILGNLKQISREAFAVSSVNSVEVYGNIDMIDIDAFFQCYNLQKFICHGTVKHVGAQAFYHAKKLSKLSLGKNIQSIGTGAFEGCDKVKKPHVKKK